MPRRLTTEEFIEKAKTVHGDRYDYSQVRYVNTYTKVTIVCGKHGSFQVAPTRHLSNGAGCLDLSVKKKSGQGVRLIAFYFNQDELSVEI